MNLMGLLLNSGSGSLIQKVASVANLDSSGAKNLLGMIGGQLMGQTKDKIAGSDDSSNLEEVISSNKFQNRVDNPEIEDEETLKNEGNTLLGMITGSKNKSREIATNVSNKSGVDIGIIKNLLPMIAPSLVGSMSKRNTQTGKSTSILSMLDMDGDGEIMDDIMGFAKKFF